MADTSRKILIALCLVTLSLQGNKGSDYGDKKSTSEACNQQATPAEPAQSVELDRSEAEGADAKAVFRVLAKDASSDARCQQRGIEKCFFVNLDTANLDSLVGTGETVRAFSGLDIVVKVVSKSGNSYRLEGPEVFDSSMTVGRRVNGPSIYGSIRTNDGVYNIESCDKDGGCNVAIYRPHSFFAEMEHKDDAVIFGEGR